MKEWFSGELKDFLGDTFGSMSARKRDYINSKAVLNNFQDEAPFSRRLWGLSLELWQQQFHDEIQYWHDLKKNNHAQREL